MLKARLLSGLLLLGLSLLACEPEPSTTPTVTPAVVEQLPRPSIDVEAMRASIEWLASDERQGRFTLDPQIDEVAGWIAAHYEELGLEPVTGAQSLRVTYELRTKVEAGPGSKLAIGTAPVAPEHFRARAEGRSGAVTGELVFVGYGLSWNPGARDQEQGEGEGEGPSVEPYDELAGVDLDGKVALALAYAPNTPDLMQLFAAIQTIGEEFEAAAQPLREADKLRKLEKLHRKAREDLVELVAPFVDTKDLGDAYWKVEDPKASLDIMRLASVFATRTGSRPQFDPRDISFDAKARRLAEAGASAVIFVNGPRSFVGRAARDADELPDADEGGGQLSSGGHAHVLPDPAPIPIVQLSWKQADGLLKVGGQKLSKIQAELDADYRPRSQALGVDVELVTELVAESVEVPNVLAQLPGKTDEVVIIGAHFDHIGNDETGTCRAIVRRDSRDAICNGADDNASGTAMLLELARAYTQLGVTPERTIVFAHFSGEELGLLGSAALMGDPPFDQDRVVAMVNLDMVGRLGPRGLAIGGIHSSDDWMPLLDELGNYGMQILYEGSTTTRSDHAHWFRRQIPVLFFFTGMHGDYHRAGDELDEINWDGLASIGQFVGDLVWELAEGRAIAWTEPRNGDGIGRGLPGSDPSTVIKKVDESGELIED